MNLQKYFLIYILSTWQKIEYIEFGCVCRSEKHVWDFLKTILDQWLSPSPMLQNFYRFNVYIFMFTNEIRPYKSHADHRKQTCDTHSVTQVGVLDVEARRFHGTEMPVQSPSVFYRSLLHLQVGWNRSGSEVQVSRQSSWFDFRQDRHTALYAKKACSRISPVRL